MNDNLNWQFCYFCKRYNHPQEKCCARIQENQPCTDKQGRKYWPRQYTMSNKPQQREISPISALTGFVEPLMQSPLVIPQLIVNLCVVSLATCTKLFDILAPRDKVRPRINVRARNQTTSWVFDTGVAIRCMNSGSFNTAFGPKKTRKVSNSQSCVAASSDAINSTEVY